GQLWFQAEPQNGSSGDEGALNWTSWIGRVTPSGKMSFLPVRTGLTPLSLYSTSQAERDRWAGEQEAGSDPHLVLWTAGESRPPRPIGRFPAGTRAIAYYLSFLGAQPDATTYQAVIRDVWGGVLVRGVTHTLTL